MTSTTTISTTMAAVQLPNSKPVKDDSLHSTDMRRNRFLRPMQSQPNLRYATTTTPSIQLTATHAIYTNNNISNNNNNSNNSSNSSPITSSSKKQGQQPQPSRTQNKLLLQRQSFLADDKDYLEHPANMRRLTKELDRVNREYQSIRYFEHPLAESFRRVALANNNNNSPPSSFCSSTGCSK